MNVQSLSAGWIQFTQYLFAIIEGLEIVISGVFGWIFDLHFIQIWNDTNLTC